MWGGSEEIVGTRERKRARGKQENVKKRERKKTKEKQAQTGAR